MKCFPLGLAGLLTELLVGAEKFGLLKEALADYDRAFPGLLQKVGHSIASLPLHAARRSEEMAELRETFLHYGLDPIVVPSVGKILRAISDLKSDKASAFKVIHAGLTKGLAGLLTELLVGAEKFGLLKEALADYDRAFPGLLQKVGHSIASLPLHAARRSEEMAELRETFLHYGLDPIVVPSVEKILRAISDLKSDKASLTNTRGETLANTIKLFSERGLLRDSSSQK